MTTDIRTARILADPVWYGAVVAAMFVAEANLQAQDYQNASRVLSEAIHRVNQPISRVTRTVEQAIVEQAILDAVAYVLLRAHHTRAFVAAAVSAEVYLGANNPGAAYQTLAAVMSAVMGERAAALRTGVAA